MIKLGNEGYYFVSDSGIKYDLYEGLTFGNEKRYTSDMVFVVLSDRRYLDNVGDLVVGGFFGAVFFDAAKDSEDDLYIGYIVQEYEKKNNIYKKDIEF